MISMKMRGGTTTWIKETPAKKGSSIASKMEKKGLMGLVSHQPWHSELKRGGMKYVLGKKERETGTATSAKGCGKEAGEMLLTSLWERGRD